MKCLNDYKNHPIKKITKINNRGLGDFTGEVRKALKTLGSKGDPNKDAFEFYFLNHCFSELKNRLLPNKPLCDFSQKVCDLYHDVTVKQACRLFCYITLICTRETRHTKSTIFDLAKEVKGSTFKYEVDEYFDFLSDIKGGGSSSVIEKFLANPPSIELGEYVKGTYLTFYNGSWNGGYGGKKWAAVAKLLLKFVEGEITPEIFVDQAYTLCHNNGPIFNKGILYNHYASNYLNFLDMQAKGDMPYVFSLHKKGSADSLEPYKSETLLHLYDDFYSYFGESFFKKNKDSGNDSKKKPKEKQDSTVEYYEVLGPCGVKVEKIDRTKEKIVVHTHVNHFTGSKPLLKSSLHQGQFKATKELNKWIIE